MNGNKIQFERVSWLTSIEKRNLMVDDLIEKKVLIGLSKQEIIDYLGDEFNDMNSDKWSYYLGYKIPVLNLFRVRLYLFFNDRDLVYSVVKK